ncbi:hypothetical protein EJ08DRAFT_651293 [Tothia fuscella]|uniref:Uncharacterized protein n=1 Tax=Tothia fuscella TaxID=1048955 RepID=A0A9P4NM14_9PEZI|nr:hypothetical protein EJ08DRAFT_651293 [Tothia fuscella]
MARGSNPNIDPNIDPMLQPNAGGVGGGAYAQLNSTEREILAGITQAEQEVRDAEKALQEYKDTIEKLRLPSWDRIEDMVFGRGEAFLQRNVDEAKARMAEIEEIIANRGTGNKGKGKGKAVVGQGQ